MSLYTSGRLSEYTRRRRRTDEQKDIKKHIHRDTDIQMMKKKKEEEKEYEIIRDWIVEVAYLQIE